MQDVDVAADYREILAANVRSARTRRNVTQTSLARRMKRLGYRWHFQTVGAVERGERRLMADELLGLSVALETPMSVLVYRSPQDEELVSLPAGLRVALPEARRRPDEPAPLLWDADDVPCTRRPGMRSQETRGLTLAAVRKWPPTCDVGQAARALGISRSSAYSAIASGEFPVATIRVSRRLRVLTASLITMTGCSHGHPAMLM